MDKFAEDPTKPPISKDRFFEDESCDSFRERFVVDHSLGTKDCFFQQSVFLNSLPIEQRLRSTAAIFNSQSGIMTVRFAEVFPAISRDKGLI